MDAAGTGGDREAGRNDSVIMKDCSATCGGLTEGSGLTGL